MTGLPLFSIGKWIIPLFRFLLTPYLYREVCEGKGLTFFENLLNACRRLGHPFGARYSLRKLDVHPDLCVYQRIRLGVLFNIPHWLGKAMGELLDLKVKLEYVDQDITENVPLEFFQLLIAARTKLKEERTRIAFRPGTAIVSIECTGDGCRVENSWVKFWRYHVSMAIHDPDDPLAIAAIPGFIRQNRILLPSVCSHCFDQNVSNLKSNLDVLMGPLIHIRSEAMEKASVLCGAPLFREWEEEVEVV